MNHSTSPKTYIILITIATFAIAAVTSQVLATPVATTSACSIYASSVDSTSGSFAVSNNLGAATGITDTVYASWRASDGTSVEVIYNLSQPVLHSSSYDLFEWYGYNPEWTVVYAHDMSTDTWVTVFDGTAGSTPDWRWQYRSEAYAMEGHYIDKIKINSNWYGTIYVDAIRVSGYCEDVPLPATPLPQAALPCITGTTSISTTTKATMTPFGPTRTAAPTRTPGGPTPTATPPYTVTVQPISGTASYDSGVIKFDTDVSQLSARGTVNSSGMAYKFLRWDPTIGNDGKPGVGYFHDMTIQFGMTLTVQDVDTITGMVSFEKPGGFGSGPVAVSLYARTAYTMTTGQGHWIRVWYLDNNYDGQGTAMWVSQWDTYVQGANTPSSTVGGLQLSNTWRKLGAVVQAPAGHTISAIGFDDYMSGSGEPGAPCTGYGCVYMDDLRVGYGDAAGLVLPYCEGTDPRAGRNGTYKTCVVNVVSVDVLSACVAPTSLDLGAWLQYLWCRIWRYFGFLTENRAQVDAIIARQSVNEPFGSVSEVGAINDDLNDKITQLRSTNKPAVQSPIDWIATMLDGSALDRLPRFEVPDVGSAAQYMSDCPAEAMFSNSTASGACMALYMMRQTIIITLFQWGLNAIFVVGVVMMIRSDLEKLAA
jgi:hypothetical protein